MRTFVNLFLILFLADGGFSLVDELVPLLTPLLPFSAFRNLLAGSVIVTAAAVYLCVGLDRRLPKKVLLPLVFFVFFCPISTWLFPPLGDFPLYGLFTAAVQLALGMLPLCWFRNGDVRSVTMPPELFNGSPFSLKNTLSFGAVNLIVTPVMLLIVMLAAADAYMAEFTSGFMRLAPGGLRMTERVYRHNNRTIRLAAMIHIGKREYYKELTESIASSRTIILAEGVSDRDNLLRSAVDYRKMADFLGLASQQEMQFRGRLIDEEEFAAFPLRSSTVAAGKRSADVDILRADVDVADFRQPTLLLLNTVGACLKESRSVIAGIRAINTWGEKTITPEMSAIIMDDILHRRNAVVISQMDRALDRYDTVIIPWGALHMKEIEAEVLKRGFTLTEERARVSIDFRTLLSGLM